MDINLATVQSPMLNKFNDIQHRQHHESNRNVYSWSMGSFSHQEPNHLTHTSNDSQINPSLLSTAAHHCLTVHKLGQVNPNELRTVSCALRLQKCNVIANHRRSSLYHSLDKYFSFLVNVSAGVCRKHFLNRRQLIHISNS